MKRYIIPTLIISVMVISCLQTEKKGEAANHTTSQIEANYEEEPSDSIKKLRSEEIRKAILINGIDEFSTLDYSFMVEELNDIKSKDTLFYELPSLLTANVSAMHLSSAHLNINDTSKFIYWPDATNGVEKFSQNQYVASAVGVEMIGYALKINSQFEKSYVVLAENMFKAEGNKIDIINIPNTFQKYDANLLSLNIKENAFSEVVGEGEIFDLLIKDLEGTLKIISNDSTLMSRYNTWLESLSTPSGWLYFSDSYPAPLHARKLNFLIGEVEKSEHPLTDKLLLGLEEVQIVKLEE